MNFSIKDLGTCISRAIEAAGSGGGEEGLERSQKRGWTGYVLDTRPGWARKRRPWVGMQRGAILSVIVSFVCSWFYYLGTIV